MTKEIRFEEIKKLVVITKHKGAKKFPTQAEEKDVYYRWGDGWIKTFESSDPDANACPERNKWSCKYCPLERCRKYKVTDPETGKLTIVLGIPVSEDKVREIYDEGRKFYYGRLDIPYIDDTGHLKVCCQYDDTYTHCAKCHPCGHGCEHPAFRAV